MPNALDRIPDLTPEKREEVKAVAATVEVAIKTADKAVQVEQSRERDQNRSMGQDRGGGMGI